MLPTAESRNKSGNSPCLLQAPRRERVKRSTREVCTCTQRMLCRTLPHSQNCNTRQQRSACKQVAPLRMTFTVQLRAHAGQPRHTPRRPLGSNHARHVLAQFEKWTPHVDRYARDSRERSPGGSETHVQAHGRYLSLAGRQFPFALSLSAHTVQLLLGVCSLVSRSLKRRESWPRFPSF